MLRLLKLLAVFVTYLFLAWPVAQAATINIIPPAGPSQQVTLNYSDYVSVQVSKNTPETHKIKVTISNATSDYEIKKVFIYRCKSRNPNECVSQPATVDEFSGNAEKVYSWTACELSDTCGYTGFPQIGNLFMLARVSDSYGKEFWAGSWYKVERTGGSTYNVYSYPTGDADVHITDSVYIDSVANFLNLYKMVPMYPVWTESVIFHLASSIFRVSSNMTTINSRIFESSETGGSQVLADGMDDDFNFMLQNTGAGITDPLTLFRNSAATCGNGYCESDLGENPSSCCYDCSCQSGQYCDGGTLCKVESMIMLARYGSPSMKVGDCTKNQDMTIQVRIVNQPTGAILQSLKYRLDGASVGTNCKNVQAAGNIYSCTITIPGDPDCAGGGFEFDPNYIDAVIKYPDGPRTEKYKEMAVNIGMITAGSYTCGQFGCETSLGENSQVCCYDCGCTTGYCSTNAGDPATGTCKPSLGNSNLRAIATLPASLSFRTHNPTDGESIDLDLRVENRPVAMSLQNVFCSLSCPGCSASCNIQCQEASSNNPNTYNSTCELIFKISDYDQAKNYDLTSEINMNFNYYDKSELKTAQLKTSLGHIIIGSHVCGDGTCDRDILSPENSADCCYDCGCVAGDGFGETYYCDAATSDPSSGSCKTLEPIDIDGTFDVTSFDDSAPEEGSNVITFTGTLDSPPTGWSITGTSELQDGLYRDTLKWGTDCETISFGPPVQFRCKIGVPSFDPADEKFVEKYGNMYDYNEHKITLIENNITFEVAFNDGDGTKVIAESFDPEDITLDVVYHCDDGVCSGGGDSDECMTFDDDENCVEYYKYLDLGETSANCCIDCACPDLEDENEKPIYYCPCVDAEKCAELHIEPGCRSRQDIRLVIESGELGCYIYAAGDYPPGGCIFDAYALPGNLRLYVENPPADFSTSFDGYNEYVSVRCTAPSMKLEPDMDPATADYMYPQCASCQLDEEASDENRLYYDCFLTAYGRINNMNEGIENRSVKVEMSVRYGQGMVRDTLNVESPINISRENSMELNTLNMEIEEAQAWIDGLETARNWVIVVASVGGAIWIATCLCAAIIPCNAFCSICSAICSFCWTYGFCIESSLVTLIFTLQSQIETYNSDLSRLQLRLNGNYDDYSAESTGLGWTIGAAIAGIVSTILCAIATVGANTATVPATGGGGGFGAMNFLIA